VIDGYYPRYRLSALDETPWSVDVFLTDCIVPTGARPMSRLRRPLIPVPETCGTLAATVTLAERDISRRATVFVAVLASRRAGRLQSWRPRAVLEGAASRPPCSTTQGASACSAPCGTRQFCDICLLCCTGSCLSLNLGQDTHARTGPEVYYDL